MKTILLILVTLLISIPSFAQDAACSDIGIPDYISKLFASRCDLNEGEDKFCLCLKEESEKNILKLSQKIDVKEEIRKHNEKTIKKNSEHLKNIYTKLNYEVSFQERKFSMTNPDKGLVGCTPSDMAKEFNRSLEEKYNVSSDGGEIIDVPLSKLSDAELIKKEAEINARYKYSRYEKKNAVIPIVNSYSMTLSPNQPQISVPVGLQYTNQIVATDVEYVPAEMDKTTHTNDLEITNPLNAACNLQGVCSEASQIANDKVIRDTFIKSLKEAKEFFVKHPNLFRTADLKDIDALIHQVSTNYNSLDHNLINKIDQEYKDKKQYFKEFSKKNSTPVAEEVATNALEQIDLDIQSEFKEDMTVALPNACIDYQQFKAFNSAPSEKLIENLSALDHTQIEALLDPKNLKSSSELTNFLKQNPVIAKNTINPGQRKNVAQALHGLITKMKGKNDPKDRFSLYSDFMKMDIAKINANDKMMDFLQCDLLARNFAAMTTSTELPALGLMGDNNLSHFANQSMACKIRQENKINNVKEQPTIQDLINSNDLFSLFDSSPMRPSEDSEYTAFLDKNCVGFEAFFEKQIKKNCINPFAFKSCRQKALNPEEGKRQRFKERYFEENINAAEAKKISDLVSANTADISYEMISKKTDKKFQDKPARQTYVDKVQPVLVGRSIYSTENIFRPSGSGSTNSSQQGIAGSSTASDEVSIFNTIESAQNSYSAGSYAATGPSNSSSVLNKVSDINPSMNSNESSSVTDYSSSNAVNPGQVIPPFMNGGQRQPEIKKVTGKITNLEDIEDSIEDSKSLAPEERKEFIEDAKEFLASQENKNSQINDLNKKIAEMEKDLKNEQKTSVKSGPSRSIASIDKKTFVPESTNNFGQRAAVNAPSYSGSNFAGGKVSLSSNEKSAASYTRALTQADEIKKISIEEQSSMRFDGPIMKGEQPGDILVGVSLTPDSKTFALISQGGSGNEEGQLLKEYLVKNNIQMIPNQVISIKCQDTQSLKCGKENELLISVSMDRNNKIVLRSLSKDVPVVRTSSVTYKDLVNTMELETKTKISK